MHFKLREMILNDYATFYSFLYPSGIEMVKSNLLPHPNKTIVDVLDINGDIVGCIESTIKTHSGDTSKHSSKPVIKNQEEGEKYYSGMGIAIAYLTKNKHKVYIGTNAGSYKYITTTRFIGDDECLVTKLYF